MTCSGVEFQLNPFLFSLFFVFEILSLEIREKKKLGGRGLPFHLRTDAQQAAAIWARLGTSLGHLQYFHVSPSR